MYCVHCTYSMRIYLLEYCFLISYFTLSALTTHHMLIVHYVHPPHLYSHQKNFSVFFKKKKFYIVGTIKVYFAYSCSTHGGNQCNIMTNYHQLLIINIVLMSYVCLCNGMKSFFCKNLCQTLSTNIDSLLHSWGSLRVAHTHTHTLTRLTLHTILPTCTVFVFVCSNPQTVLLSVCLLITIPTCT